MLRARAILHVGTHKTGTKTLQAFLLENRLAFARAGIYVPASGRAQLGPDTLSPGHHALAWDVLHGGSGVLAEVLADIQAARPPAAILSSEEFVHLHMQPGRAAFLRDAFGASGYDVTIVLYVRSQAPYAESLYAELTKSGMPPPFGVFLNTLLAQGEMRFGDRRLAFEYDRIALAFASSFGAQSVVVRPYPEGAAPRVLIDDFLRVLARLGGGLALRDLRLTLPHANERGTFAQVFERYLESVRGESPPSLPPLAAPIANAPFAPLRREDTIALVRRFAPSNEALEAIAGITLPGTREADVLDAADPHWASAAAQRALLDELANGLRSKP